MKIAVIGASGEIGARFAQTLLVKGNNPRLISRRLGFRLARWEEGEMDFRQADLSTHSDMKTLLRGCDVVINCAVNKSFLEVSKAIKDNLLICKKLLDAAIECNVQKFIHLSSIVVLPPKLTNNVLSATPCEYSREKDWYTRVKIETERLVTSYYSKIPIIIVRPGIVYGPYMNWSYLAFSLCREKTVVIPAGPNTCAAVHVDDLVNLCLYLAEHNASSQHVYAVNPEVISWKEFFEGHFATGDVISLPKECIPVGQVEWSPLSRFLFWCYHSPLIPDSLRSGNVVQKLRNLFVENCLTSDHGDCELELDLSQIKIPNRFELELYSSDANFTPNFTGEDLGFSYGVSFENGCSITRDWLRFVTN